MSDVRRVIGLALAMLLPTAAPAGPEPAPAAVANSCADDAGWNDPATPFRIHGSTWYVGTCGISALLVTSPRGHVLIDAGTEKAGPLVEASIRAAGFRPRDIRYIVNSHAHHDHAGGIAHMQRISGAVVVARAPSVATLRTGRSDSTDPQVRTTRAFPAVRAVRTIRDGGTLAAGPISLTAHATPGHMPGGTAWTWRSCEGATCIDVAYVDSLTAVSDPDYRFGDEGVNPGVLASFRRTLDTVAALPCDALVTPHPSASDLWSRVGARATRRFTQPGACRAYADGARGRLAERLAKEESAP